MANLLPLTKGISCKQQAVNLLVKTCFFICVLLMLNKVNAQNLTLSNAGQTGTSGTNWNTSGSNPVTITATGTASVNTSVIEGYLNAGTSVIVANAATGTTINSNISKTTGANASLTIKDIAHIKVAANVNISSVSNALDIILWADSDNSQGGTIDDFIFLNPGTGFSSNGGKIVMAGGPDNGSNGGTGSDGIPDGFAWNGSNSVTYGANLVGGLNLGPTAGAGTVISLTSNGGDIILRGATSNNSSLPGITSQSNLSIVSGAGKITMFGKSTTGHGIELTYGGSPAIAISSSSSSVPAIDLKGTTTMNGYSGFWASNNANGNVLIQSSAPSGGGISIEGVSSSGYGLLLGVSATNIITQVLSQSGTIALKGSGNANNSILLYGDMFIGNRKDANSVQGVTPGVTASTADILVQANDQYQFSNTAGRNTNINSTGSLTMEAYSNGYTGTVSWTGNRIFGTAFSNITLGEAAENYSFTLNNSLTTTGNITAYSNNFTLSDGIGLASSGAGNININANSNFGTAGTTRRTISTVNGNINVFADADANGNGQLDIDYLTFNPGTGTTKLRTETMNWGTAANTDKPYFNGTGAVVIEPADASFQDVHTVWFFFDQDANGMAGFRIGKSTNTGNVTITNPLTVAGGISLYGGIVTLNANLTSSATGDIFIKSNSNVNAAASIAANASVFKTAGTGTLTMQSQDRLNSGIITASGTGVLNVVLWSDFDNNNNGGVYVGPVTTNGGHFWLGGTSTNGGSYIWNGLAVGNGPSVASVNNNHNAIDFSGPISTSGGDVLVWGGNGYGGGSSGIALNVGPSSINSGSGSITLIADNIAQNNLTITSTGLLSLVPDGGSYPSAITWSGTITGGNFNGSSTFDYININNFASLGGLSIGYYDGHLTNGIPEAQSNTSNITVGMASSVAGPVKLYGTNLTINQNLASTAAGNISLFANNFSIAGGVNISSAGNLVIEPITAATTIGLAGGAGALAVTAANFSSNFSDGFAEIRIGNSSSGNITLGAAMTIQDNLRLSTGGNLVLNEIITLGNNNCRFIGSSIAPATNKFVKTNGVGKLMMDISNNSSKLFPVGISYYNPVTITNNTGIADNFYVTASDSIYKDGGISGTAVAWIPRVNVTWNVGNASASTGAGNVDLAFGWNAADITGVFNAPRLLHHTGISWGLLGGIPAFDLGANTLTYTGYSGTFSPFAIAENNSTLPVKWLSFTGKKVQHTVVLKWVTTLELNNAYFDVERTKDGNTFTSIGRVMATLSPAAENVYNYTDQQPLSGHSWYRLKQVDLDGRVNYSAIVSISSLDEQGYSVAAIPGSKQLQLTIPQSLSGKADLMIYDGTGRQVMRRQVQAGSSIIYTGSLITGGIYFVKISQGNNQLFSKRFIN